MKFSLKNGSMAIRGREKGKGRTSPLSLLPVAGGSGSEGAEKSLFRMGLFFDFPLRLWAFALIP